MSKAQAPKWMSSEAAYGWDCGYEKAQEELSRLTERVERLELREMDLEDALHQAQWTVSFLLDCLNHPDHHQHAYPEQTERHLKEWAELAPPPELCPHSRPEPGCSACEAHGFVAE